MECLILAVALLLISCHCLFLSRSFLIYKLRVIEPVLSMGPLEPASQVLTEQAGLSVEPDRVSGPTSMSWVLRSRHWATSLIFPSLPSYWAIFWAYSHHCLSCIRQLISVPISLWFACPQDGTVRTDSIWLSPRQMVMLPFQTEPQMPGTQWGAPSFWLQALWGGHIGQVPATFCSGLPNDVFGKRQGRTEEEMEELIRC